MESLKWKIDPPEAYFIKNNQKSQLNMHVLAQNDHSQLDKEVKHFQTFHCFHCFRSILRIFEFMSPPLRNIFVPCPPQELVVSQNMPSYDFMAIALVFSEFLLFFLMESLIFLLFSIVCKQQNMRFPLKNNRNSEITYVMAMASYTGIFQPTTSFFGGKVTKILLYGGLINSKTLNINLKNGNNGKFENVLTLYLIERGHSKPVHAC